MYLSLQGIYWLILIAVSVWLIAIAMTSQARVQQRVQAVCRENGLQWLDQNVVLKSLRLRKRKTAGLYWQRVYQFEFTHTGSHRYKGWLFFDNGRHVHTELQPWHLD